MELLTVLGAITEDLLYHPALMQLIYPFATGFVVAFVAIPSLITIAREKNLQDDPDHRKKHGASIPTLGGIAIFAGIIISYTFWSADVDFVFFKYTLISILILFFSGAKDDVIGLSVSKRILIHLVAISIVVIFGQVKITHLNGIFGITEIPLVPSYILTVVIIFAITNSVNLIDGIDGLASGLVMMASLMLGAWFFIRGDHTTQATLAFAMSGALMGFLMFNFNPAKIFMGDTGALIIGFLIAVVTIQFINFNVFLENGIPFEILKTQEINYYVIRSAPAVAIGMLMVPIFDVIRVMLVRLLQKKPLFTPDRNHIHHLLVDVLGFSHAKASVTLYIFAFAFMTEAYYLQKIGTLNLILVLFGTATLLSLILRQICRAKIKQNQTS
jgi:UDP-N-acetylmuramyl pentapeptide phosphotransferase/UDP-N-acetylglucosamine-1-phosphate transferase